MLLISAVVTLLLVLVLERIRLYTLRKAENAKYVVKDAYLSEAVIENVSTSG